MPDQTRQARHFNKIHPFIQEAPRARDILRLVIMVLLGELLPVLGYQEATQGYQEVTQGGRQVLKRPSPATLQLLHQAGIARTRSTTLGRLTMISTLLGGEDTEEYI